MHHLSTLNSALTIFIRHAQPLQTTNLLFWPHNGYHGCSHVVVIQILLWYIKTNCTSLRQPENLSISNKLTINCCMLQLIRLTLRFWLVSCPDPFRKIERGLGMRLIFRVKLQPRRSPWLSLLHSHSWSAQSRLWSALKFDHSVAKALQHETYHAKAEPDSY